MEALRSGGRPGHRLIRQEYLPSQTTSVLTASIVSAHESTYSNNYSVLHTYGTLNW